MNGKIARLIIAVLSAAALTQVGRADNFIILPQGASREIVRIPPCIEYFPELPSIAERLHVAPYADGKPSAMVLAMCDGRKYDFMELINALLNRLDQQEKK